MPPPENEPTGWLHTAAPLPYERMCVRAAGSHAAAVQVASTSCFSYTCTCHGVIERKRKWRQSKSHGARSSWLSSSKGGGSRKGGSYLCLRCITTRPTCLCRRALVLVVVVVLHANVQSIRTQSVAHAAAKHRKHPLPPCHTAPCPVPALLVESTARHPRTEGPSPYPRATGFAGFRLPSTHYN